MLFKKLIISFVISLSLIFNITCIYAIDVYLGGESVGIVLNYDGILITGAYEIEYHDEKYNPFSDFKLYDIIVEADNQKVTSIDELSKIIENSNDQINVIVKRNNQNINLDMKIAREQDDFSTGLYVKDSVKGIGTVTYYNPKTGNLACLGHSITDENNQYLQNGNLYTTVIENIKKSTKLEVGKKIGSIQNQKIGDIDENNDYGIFGQYINDLHDKTLYQTASQDEVELGNAYFLTVLDNNTVSKCHIEITALEKQDNIKEKGIHFKLVDQEIITKTNGIVQGMSGSPIIQNNKLIGCVTHASSSNNLEGYGMYIEWMIDKE